MERSLRGNQHWDEISAFLTQAMNEAQIPGLSLAVLHAGNLLFAQGYGVASIELAVPASSQTVYGLGSVTKTFTATAILHLVQEGRLGLDERTRTYLPEAPASWSEMTLRHLLTHSAGLPPIIQFGQYGASEQELQRLDIPRDEVLRAIFHLPLDFPPRTQTRYGSTGYILLGTIIERVSGKPYSQFLAERIFQPLGMTSTRLNDPAAIIPHRAAGYRLEEGTLKNAEFVSALWHYAPNGLVSSVLDLARWDAALTAGWLLSPSLLDQMWEPTTLADGQRAEFGLAWSVEQTARGKLVTHVGSRPGYASYRARFLDAQVSIILLANRRHAPLRKLGQSLAQRIFESHSEIASNTRRAGDPPSCESV